ncbi:tyrosine-type recombinase/integrase [Vibrio jasicida]|uniref:tyrosine-type recombinase/integrase n=1 Tax=Vibrio jasicida TaxID=766224 RepID=UPI0011B0084E|nr:site-specific integrase [Vibrio jasicida]
MDVTVEHVIDAWYKSWGSKHRKGIDKMLPHWKNQLGKEILSIPIEVATLAIWRHHIEDLSERLSTGSARTIFSELKSILNWGLRNELFFNANFTKLKRSDYIGRYNGRERFLSMKEVARVWNITHEPHKNLGFLPRLVIQLCLIYGNRLSELVFAEKSHFDLETMVWTVPKELSKGGHVEIRRPIIEPALPIIMDIMAASPNSKYMFPTSYSKKEDKPVTKARYSKVAKIVRDIAPDMDHWIIHDFRRTLKTHLSERRVPYEVTEKMLGHVIPGIASIYDKSSLLDMMKESYNQWYDDIELAAAKERGEHSNVFAINAR